MFSDSKNVMKHSIQYGDIENDLNLEYLVDRTIARTSRILI